MAFNEQLPISWCLSRVWARGYAVSTVGFELEQVRQYIREQDAADGEAGQF